MAREERFVDCLSLVNMLPGPLATQLGIYIGHAKQWIAGGIGAIAGTLRNTLGWEQFAKLAGRSPLSRAGRCAHTPAPMATAAVLPSTGYRGV
jgi:hypothetical protein